MPYPQFAIRNSSLIRGSQFLIRNFFLPPPWRDPYDHLYPNPLAFERPFPLT